VHSRRRLCLAPAQSPRSHQRRADRLTLAARMQIQSVGASVVGDGSVRAASCHATWGVLTSSWVSMNWGAFHAAATLQWQPPGCSARGTPRPPHAAGESVAVSKVDLVRPAATEGSVTMPARSMRSTMDRRKLVVLMGATISPCLTLQEPWRGGNADASLVFLLCKIPSPEHRVLVNVPRCREHRLLLH